MLFDSNNIHYPRRVQGEKEDWVKGSLAVVLILAEFVFYLFAKTVMDGHALMIAGIFMLVLFALVYRAIIQWIEGRWQLTLDEKPST